MKHYVCKYLVCLDADMLDRSLRHSYNLLSREVEL